MKQTSKILGSVLVIAVASALVAVGTMAWFTDTEKIEGNIFGTGTLDISLTSPEILPFSVTDMAPGDPEVTNYLTVANDGTLNLQFRALVTWTEDSGPGGEKLSDVLMVKVTLVEGQGAIGSVLYEGSLAGIDLLPWDSINVPEWPYEPGWSTTYEIDVWLPSDVGNEYQGLSIDGTITVQATQWDVDWDDAF